MFVLCALLSIVNGQLSIAQQGDIEAQNAVKRRAQERLAEIERLTKTLSGDIVRSEKDLRVARGAIRAKRKIVSELESESKSITAEMNSDNRAVKRLDSTLSRLKHDYGRMVYASWKSRRTSGAAQFLLASRDFNDAARRIAFIRRYNRARERKGLEIDSLGSSLRAEIARLEAKREEIAGLQRESNAVIASLASDEARYATALKTLGSDRNKLQAEEKRERAKIAAAQREIDRIMARQAREARGEALTEAEVKLSGRFGDNKGKLPWPTGTPGLILHHFGKERGSDGIVSDFKGLIIAARPGSEVKAVFEGRVMGIYDLGQYDKCVIVRSGEYVVGYGNISLPAVKKDDRVTLSQSLGRLGNSDNPDRHRVMLWMQFGEKVLDPEEWLR